MPDLTRLISIVRENYLVGDQQKALDKALAEKVLGPLLHSRPDIRDGFLVALKDREFVTDADETRTGLLSMITRIKPTLGPGASTRWFEGTSPLTLQAADNPSITHLKIDPAKPTAVLLDFNGVFDYPERALLFFEILQGSPLVYSFYLFGGFPNEFLEPARFAQLRRRFPKLTGDLCSVKYVSRQDIEEQAQAFRKEKLTPDYFNILLFDDHASSWGKLFNSQEYPEDLRGAIQPIQVTPGENGSPSSILEDWRQVASKLAVDPFPDGNPNYVPPNWPENGDKGDAVPRGESWLQWFDWYGKVVSFHKRIRRKLAEGSTPTRLEENAYTLVSILLGERERKGAFQAMRFLRTLSEEELSALVKHKVFESGLSSLWPHGFRGGRHLKPMADEINRTDYKAFADNSRPHFMQANCFWCEGEKSVFLSHIVNFHLQPLFIQLAGIPRYDLEIAAFHQLDVSMITETIISRINQTDEWISKKITDEWTNYLMLPEDYRQLLANTLRYIEQLGLAQIDWSLIRDLDRLDLDFPLDIDIYSADFPFLSKTTNPSPNSHANLPSVIATPFVSSMKEGEEGAIQALEEGFAQGEVEGMLFDHLNIADLQFEELSPDDPRYSPRDAQFVVPLGPARREYYAEQPVIVNGLSCCLICRRTSNLTSEITSFELLLPHGEKIVQGILTFSKQPNAETILSSTFVVKTLLRKPADQMTEAERELETRLKGVGLGLWLKMQTFIQHVANVGTVDVVDEVLRDHSLGSDTNRVLTFEQWHRIFGPYLADYDEVMAGLVWRKKYQAARREKGNGVEGSRGESSHGVEGVRDGSVVLAPNPHIIEKKGDPPVNSLFHIIGVEQENLASPVSFHIVGARPEEAAAGVLEEGLAQVAPTQSSPSHMKIRGAVAPTSIFSSTRGMSLPFKMIR